MEHITDQADTEFTYCDQAVTDGMIVVAVEDIDRDYACTDCLVAFDARYAR